jgi:hypothetical protein
MMNVAAMAGVTVLIFAEKTLPRSQWATRATAVALIAYGGLVVALPHTLPTFRVWSDRAAPTHGLPMQMDMSGHRGAASPSP